MELTKDQIEKINEKCPYGQGVFREPFGIPDDLKELVVYTKWYSGGKPGSYWDDENTINEEYTHDRPNDVFIVLDLVLKELMPDISYLNFKKIESLINSNIETESGWYGDYTEDTIEWIVLPELIEALLEF